MALGLFGPDLSLWLTALPAVGALLVIAAVLVVPRLGAGRARPGRREHAQGDRARRATRWWAAPARRCRSCVRGNLLVITGAVGYWAWDNAVLWAAFHAFGYSPPITVILMGYLIGQLGGLLPLPGGLGGIDGGLIGTLIVYGTPAAATAAAVIVYRVILFWLPLIVGARRSSRSARAEPPTARPLRGAGADLGVFADDERDLVEVAPAPVLAGLGRPDDRVSRAARVSRGVLVRRAVAAADVAARLAHAQVHPEWRRSQGSPRSRRISSRSIELDAAPCVSRLRPSTQDFSSSASRSTSATVTVSSGCRSTPSGSRPRTGLAEQDQHAAVAVGREGQAAVGDIPAAPGRRS